MRKFEKNSTKNVTNYFWEIGVPLQNVWGRWASHPHPTPPILKDVGKPLRDIVWEAHYQIWVDFSAPIVIKNTRKCEKIKNILRKEASPRHVPAQIIQVLDIPYTFSGKKVESAVTNIINNKPVTNRDALRNPESLDIFSQLLQQLQK